MTALTHVAGWTLVHFAWQGTLIAVVAAAGLRLLRDASPQSRYVLGCLALASMLAAPAATAWRLSDEPVPLTTPIQRKVFIRVTPGGASQHEMRTVVGIRHVIGAASGVGPLAPPAGPPSSWMAAVVAVWLAGVCLLLVRLASGWWRVRQWHRTALALDPSPWQSRLDRLARWLGVRHAVRLVDVSFVDSPMVIGWVRPIVLLPIAAVSHLTPGQVEAILAHELAHVRRHDALVNAAQAIAETLLFYHPAVWWISSRIREEREHCCDDVALSVTGDAVSYAAALAELESCRSGLPAFGMAATGGSLLTRVTRLLAAPAARSSRSGAVVTAVLALTFIVGAGAMQYLVARQPVATEAPQPQYGAPAWRMLFDHPSGEMTIRGFTARDLIRFAYQLPLARVVGGPEWLDHDAFDLATTVDHVPAADETPELVRHLLEERFGLRVHEGTIDTNVFALEIARPDGVLGPSLEPATRECFDQKAWITAEAPRLPSANGERTVLCGVWDSGIDFQRVRSITMDEFAAALRPRLGPGIDRDVINRTRLEGLFDVSLEFFRPAAAAMAFTPALRVPLQMAGFLSVPQAVEAQLGLKLVPATATAKAVVIDEIRRPLDGVIRP